MRADHPLSRVETVDVELFQQQTHIVISAGRSGHIHGRAEAVLLDEIPPLNVVIKVPSFVLAAMLLRNTDHVLTIPSVAARTLATEFGLVCVPCALDLPEFTVTQYWHERFLHDPTCKWLRAHAPSIWQRVSQPIRASYKVLCRRSGKFDTAAPSMRRGHRDHLRHERHERHERPERTERVPRDRPTSTSRDSGQDARHPLPVDSVALPHVISTQCRWQLTHVRVIEAPPSTSDAVPVTNDESSDAR